MQRAHQSLSRKKTQSGILAEPPGSPDNFLPAFGLIIDILPRPKAEDSRLQRHLPVFTGLTVPRHDGRCPARLFVAYPERFIADIDRSIPVSVVLGAAAGARPLSNLEILYLLVAMPAA